ncbi:hypothetical protein Vi05172_g3889 [Venturia inaequalis]|nr:hypothetical protein Vi05172_g3889 [Venturia inaequalis]
MRSCSKQNSQANNPFALSAAQSSTTLLTSKPLNSRLIWQLLKRPLPEIHRHVFRIGHYKLFRPCFRGHSNLAPGPGSQEVVTDIDRRFPVIACAALSNGGTPGYLGPRKDGREQKAKKDSGDYRGEVDGLAVWTDNRLLW